MERFLPDHPLALFLHFTAHGVHHYVPVSSFHSETAKSSHRRWHRWTTSAS